MKICLVIGTRKGEAKCPEWLKNAVLGRMAPISATERGSQSPRRQEVSASSGPLASIALGFAGCLGDVNDVCDLNLPRKRVYAALYFITN